MGKFTTNHRNTCSMSHTERDLPLTIPRYPNSTNHSEKSWKNVRWLVVLLRLAVRECPSHYPWWIPCYITAEQVHLFYFLPSIHLLLTSSPSSPLLYEELMTGIKLIGLSRGKSRRILTVPPLPPNSSFWPSVYGSSVRFHLVSIPLRFPPCLDDAVL